MIKKSILMIALSGMSSAFAMNDCSHLVGHYRCQPPFTNMTSYDLTIKTHDGTLEIVNSTFHETSVVANGKPKKITDFDIITAICKEGKLEIQFKGLVGGTYTDENEVSHTRTSEILAFQTLSKNAASLSSRVNVTQPLAGDEPLQYNEVCTKY